MNFQNIPRSDKVIKKAFIPKLDALCFFDYEQIELRLLAYYMSQAGDDTMSQAIRDGKDLHTESAAAALRIARDLTDEERQVGKTLNFSMVYGGGKPTLVRQLGLGWDEAGTLLANFHTKWPGIRLVQDQIRLRIIQRGLGHPFVEARYVLDQAQRKRNGVSELMEVAVRGGGYITTLWGRHLHPESDHKALNALVQGCAADLMRSALVKVHGYTQAEGLSSHLVNVVHDELILDATLIEVPLLAERVPALMDHAPISEVVPIGTDMEWSRTTWADKTAYDREEMHVAA